MVPPQWLPHQRRPRSPSPCGSGLRGLERFPVYPMAPAPALAQSLACRGKIRSVGSSKRSHPKIRRFRSYTPHLSLHPSAGKSEGVRRHSKRIVVYLLPRGGEKNRYPPCSRCAVGPQVCYHTWGVAGAASNLIPPHALKRGMGIGMLDGTPYGSRLRRRPYVVPIPSRTGGPQNVGPVRVQ